MTIHTDDDRTVPRPTLEPFPRRLAKLPIDARGYPVPFFVAWIDGRPDHRVQDREKFVQAISARLCWICGEPLGRYLAFPIGPMCAINRVTSEPPAHRECAEWSIRNCPFLSNPRQVRRLEDHAPEVGPAPGHGLMRNPGVICLWITRGYEVFRAHAGEHGALITVGEPEEVTWWTDGRAATRAEVEESIAGGLPNLTAIARLEGPYALEALGQAVQRAQRYLPAAAVCDGA